MYAPQSPKAFPFLSSLAPIGITTTRLAETPTPAERTAKPYLNARLLVVDDDILTLNTIAEILSDEGYQVDCASCAFDALQALRRHTYDIILCDLFMPNENGLALMQESRKQFPEMPVILITAYATKELARQAMTLGASDFVTKPCSHDELPIVIERNLMRRRLRESESLPIANETVLSMLLTALGTRDAETEGHSERVTAFTLEIVDRLGIEGEEREQISQGALLHDIGKIGVPDSILLKPDKLTEAEWVEMKKHPLFGHQVCLPMPSLQAAGRIVLHHHERWNGSGYPHGLRGDEIPLGARIFTFADTLDAMMSDRPYRVALPFSAVREEVMKYRGVQYDPDITDIFVQIPEERWREIRQHVTT